MATAGLIPGVLTLVVPTNGCLRQDIYFADPCTCLPMDFDGYTAELQIRTSPTAATPLVTLTSFAPNGNGSQVILTETTDPYGNAFTSFEIFVSNADVAALPPANPDLPFVYDLRLVDPSGDANPYLSGAFLVTAGVSR